MLPAIRMVLSVYLKLLVLLPAILIPAYASAMTSKTILNDSGESGPLSCLIPDLMGNVCSFSPLRIMSAVGLSYVYHIFFFSKETINKVKRQPSEWEKIKTKETTDKGLISKIYKQLTLLNTSKTNNPLKIGEKT